ncbi:hypothetical protein PI124_g3542 [Phytophthora idaei]|nr:hypothetical protein PI125_g2909 [Phytophthora idaei]KAG3173696.1 hypothetical protein PI126_g757 [Phytophthora idaei]KAG3251894.1 hypothetical protein PI124_g3542 [Phytophthora idaei]
MGVGRMQNSIQILSCNAGEGPTGFVRVNLYTKSPNKATPGSNSDSPELDDARIDLVGRNRVSERVLLAQFYRSLDKTTKKLVRQWTEPKTLEEAANKANEIDDPMYNVALGMMTIGQPWATAPSPYLVPVDGTTGQTLVIPGIGGTGLSTELMSKSWSGATLTDGEGGANPRGVWNKYSGTWDVPPGRAWNGQFWYEPKRNAKKRSPEAQTPSNQKDMKEPVGAQKTRIEPAPSGSDESDVRPPKKDSTEHRLREHRGIESSKVLESP